MNIKLYVFYTQSQYLTGQATIQASGESHYDWGQESNGMYSIDVFYSGARINSLDQHLKYPEHDGVVLDYIQLYNDTYQERRLQAARPVRSTVSASVVGLP